MISRALRTFVAAVLLSFCGLGARAQDASLATLAWPQTDRGVPLRTLSFLGTPALSLGTGTDGVEFSGIVGATRLASGAVVVGDASSSRVLFFTRTGELARSVGRLGDGPGEFRLPRWLGSCGPTSIGIYDAAHASLTLLAERGELIQRVRMPSSLHFATPVGCARPEAFTVLLNRIQSRVEPGQRLRVPTAVARVGETGRLDTIHRGGVQEYYVGQSGQAYADVPLGRATLATTGRTLLFVAESFSDTVSVYGEDGTLLRRMPLGLPRPRVTRRHWERAIEDRVAAEPLDRTRTVLRSVLSEVETPALLPAVRQVVADAADHLWVRTAGDLTGEHALWLVFTAEGVPVARAALSRRQRILEIGLDYLLAVTTDEDDVETVVLHRFRQLDR